MRTEQWNHQAREFEGHRDDPARALLWQMRTGKSRHAIDVTCHWANEHGVDGALIVAPNGVHRQWVSRQLRDWWWDDVPHLAHVWDSMAKHRTRHDEAAHEEGLERLIRYRDGVAVLSVNCEALINPRVQKAIQRLFKGRRVALIGDESHRFRTPGSHRSRIMRGFRKHCALVRILTGTVIRNSPLAAWAQFEILGKGALGYDTFGGFKNSFALFERMETRGGQTYPALSGYQNLDRLTELMAPWASVVLRKDCLAGDTEILTREHGSVRIRDVAGQEVTLLDGDGNWVKCPIIDHGEQLTVALDFRAGNGINTVQVRSTLKHDWIRRDNGERIPTEAFASLQRSGHVITIAGLKPNKTVDDETEHRRGVVHGLIYGDGSADRKSGQYTITVFDKSHPDSLIPWLAEFSSHAMKYDTALGSGTGRVYNVPKSYTTTDLKAFPDPRTVTRDYLLGFLRGWFAADGTVNARPFASLACGEEECAWLRQWGPLVGWQALGAMRQPDETNLGRRKKVLYAVTLMRRSIDLEDLLIAQHRERWKSSYVAPHDGWKAVGSFHSPRVERVYCPIVPTTHSFALGSFIHSSNCEDLPALMPIVRNVEMSEEALRVYEQLRRQLVADIRDGVVVEALEGGKRAIKLQQALSGFMIGDDGQVHDLGDRRENPRIRALIEEVQGTDGKCIVWCQFHEDIRRAVEALDLEGVPFVEYHGLVRDRDKQLALDAFDGDPRIKVLIGTAQAGGEGLDLSARGATDAVINYSHTRNGITRDQGIERATMMGGKSIAIVDFECAGTMDTKILRDHELMAERSDRHGGSGLQELLKFLEAE